MERARPARASIANPGLLRLAIGFVTNFFDTLGIGSFAPTTAAFKFRRVVADEMIPGTLNVGHTLPTVAQGLIFIGIVRVGPATLVSMMAAAAIGAWLGAGVVARLPRRAIQLGMGVALSVAAILFALMNLDLLPSGGTALELTGATLACRGRDQLRARCADDARHRPVCAVPDSRQPARNESDRGVSDHDGLVRGADAGRRAAFHPRPQVRSARCARIDARRNPRGAARSLCRALSAADVAALAGRDHRFVRGRADAALGAREIGRR